LFEDKPAARDKINEIYDNTIKKQQKEKEEEKKNVSDSPINTGADIIEHIKAKDKNRQQEFNQTKTIDNAVIVIHDLAVKAETDQTLGRSRIFAFEYNGKLNVADIKIGVRAYDKRMHNLFAFVCVNLKDMAVQTSGENSGYKYNVNNYGDCANANKSVILAIYESNILTICVIPIGDDGAIIKKDICLLYGLVNVDFMRCNVDYSAYMFITNNAKFTDVFLVSPSDSAKIIKNITMNSVAFLSLY
jgi:hypothetical protein